MGIKNEPTLSWFSPLQPDPTGVAEFASYVLPSLALLGPLRIWRMRRHRRAIFRSPNGSCDAFLGQSHLPVDDVTIYHIGNSLFHISAAMLSLVRPGIIILHDTTLNALAEHIRPPPHAQQVCSPRGSNGYTGDDLLQAIVGRSLAVIVHSHNAAKLISTASCPVVRLDLPYRLPTRSDAPDGPHANRKRSHSPIRSLLIFGHLGPNRRIDSVVQAIAGMPEKESFRLDIFGHGVPSTTRALIRASGLQRIVRIHGSVSDRRLDNALATADLGFNLRFPSMGESSLSQLRYWSHAVPTVCTRHKTIAAAENAFTWYVNADAEIEDIRSVLAELLAAPQRFHDAGTLARRHLESHHSPHAYAQAVFGVVQMIGSSRKTIN